MNQDLLVRLFRSIEGVPNEDIIKVAEKIVEEEHKRGHTKLASKLKDILAKNVETYSGFRGELKTLLPKGVTIPKDQRHNIPLASSIDRENLRHEMILPEAIELKIQRIEKEYVARERLKQHGLQPKKKILLYGSPGCGKSMTAERIAWTIGLPFLKVRFEAIVSSYLGESASNLNSRNIPLSIAEKYCREVTFSLYQKSYHAIGFRNRFGGYELRNAWFKGSSSPKDITLLETGSTKVSVFEGFFDFLTHQTALQKSNSPCDFLILNSLSFAGRAAPFLEAYKAIELYLDQGQAGRKQTQQYLTQFPTARDSSNLYDGFDDLNHWHCESKRTIRQHKKLKVRR